MHDGNPAAEPQDQFSVQDPKRLNEAKSTALESIVTELRVLDAAASPAEWRRCAASSGACSCGLIWAADQESLICATSIRASDTVLSHEQQGANANLIVALRRHCRRLLDAAEDSLRWRKRCADQRRELRRFNNEDRIWVRAAVLQDSFRNQPSPLAVNEGLRSRCVQLQTERDFEVAAHAKTRRELDELRALVALNAAAR